VLDLQLKVQCADALDHTVRECAQDFVNGLREYVETYPQSTAIEIAFEILRLSDAG
jgi:hypothetical protein